MISYPEGVDLPEQRLLFCCARRALNDAFSAEIAQLCTNALDWSQVGQLADEQKVLPLLHWHLQLQHRFDLPPHVADNLRAYFSYNSQRNLVLMGEILRITRLLQEHGIAALAYKGPVLSHSAYGKVALRPCIDLDFLIQRSDVVRAAELLLKNGYRSEYYDDALASHPDTTSPATFNWFSTEHEHTFISPHTNTSIELHWALASDQHAFNYDTQKAWESRVPSDLSPSILTLCPEDLILALAIHGAKHRWKRLEWISSFAALLLENHTTLNWVQLLAKAKKSGNQRMLFIAFLLSQDLWNVAPSPIFPDFIAAPLRKDRIAASLRAHVWRELFNGLPDPTDPAIAQAVDNSPFLVRVQRRSFLIRARDRWSTRLVYTCWRLFNS